MTTPELISALRALSARSTDPQRRSIIGLVVGFVDLIGPSGAVDRVLMRLENPNITEEIAGHYEAALAVLRPDLVRVELPIEAERVAA